MNPNASTKTELFIHALRFGVCKMPVSGDM